MLSAFILLCLIFAFLLIFLLSRPPFLSACSLKRYMLSFCLRLPDFSLLLDTAMEKEPGLNQFLWSMSSH